MLSEHAKGVLIQIRVQPKASMNRVVGLHNGALKLAVTAPPDKGKANEAVVALLADVCGQAKACFSLLRGQASRDKSVLYQGPLSLDGLRSKLDQSALEQ